MDIIKHLMDIIYPPRCHICGEFIKRAMCEEERHLICDMCLESLPLMRSPICPVCSLKLPDSAQGDHLCERCIRRPPFFKKLFAPFMYTGILKNAIHGMKYRGKRQIADSLGIFVSSYAKRYLFSLKRPIVIPVPLHKDRIRMRGYNQSLLIAKQISSAMGIELDRFSLVRRMDTVPQINLKMNERMKNVRDAFKVERRENIKGRDVILVDDVATTCSTLNECARMLKKAGSGDIFCLVIARASII